MIKAIVTPFLQRRLKGRGRNQGLFQQVPHPDGRRDKIIFVGVGTCVWNLQFGLMPSGTAGHFLMRLVCVDMSIWADILKVLCSNPGED